MLLWRKSYLGWSAGIRRLGFILEKLWGHLFTTSANTIWISLYVSLFLSLFSSSLPDSLRHYFALILLPFYPTFFPSTSLSLRLPHSLYFIVFVSAPLCSLLLYRFPGFLFPCLFIWRQLVGQRGGPKLASCVPCSLFWWLEWNSCLASLNLLHQRLMCIALHVDSITPLIFFYIAWGGEEQTWYNLVAIARSSR